MRIRKFPVQTILGGWPGLRTQACCKAPGDFLVKLVQNTVINIGLARLPHEKWPKVGCGTAK